MSGPSVSSILEYFFTLSLYICSLFTDLNSPGKTKCKGKRTRGRMRSRWTEYVGGSWGILTTVVYGLGGAGHVKSLPSFVFCPWFWKLGFKSKAVLLPINLSYDDSTFPALPKCIFLTAGAIWTALEIKLHLTSNLILHILYFIFVPSKKRSLM